jgi:hypothetical protein
MRKPLAGRLLHPVTIPKAMTLKTPTFANCSVASRTSAANFHRGNMVEARLRACVGGEDPVNISVALFLVLQAERVPYQMPAD